MILFLILGAVPIWGRIIRGPPGENSGQVGLPLPENVAPMNSKEMVEYITQVNTMILRNILTEGDLGKKLGFHYKMNLPQMVKLFSSNGFAFFVLIFHLLLALHNVWPLCLITNPLKVTIQTCQLMESQNALTMTS